MNLSALRTAIDERKSDTRRIKKNLDRERRTLDGVEKQIRRIEKALMIVQQVSQEVQEQAHKRIAQVVTRCLQSVFQHPYEFKIIFERKRGRTEAKLLIKDGGHLYDPLYEKGGGLADIAALALRLSCLILSKPPLRPTIILDQPFGNVSAEFLPNVRTLLEELCEEFNIQFIMVNHIDKLMCGNVIDL